MKNSKIKICLICSVGGHLNQLEIAVKDLNYDFYWLVPQTKHTIKMMLNRRHYFITNLEYTNYFTYIINFLQSFYLLIIEKPNVIISTGAGVSIFTIYLGKKLFGAKIIYICSAANVSESSRTPKWAYKYSDLFLVQWEEMRSLFPNSINIGIL